jgi:hypothetical protein
MPKADLAALVLLPGRAADRRLVCPLRRGLPSQNVSADNTSPRALVDQLAAADLPKGLGATERVAKGGLMAAKSVASHYQSDLSRPPDDPHVVWIAAMERRGPDAVRRLLDLAGPGEGASVPVGDRVTENVPRSVVEQWLRRKDAEQQAIIAKEQARRDWWTRGIAIVALVASIVVPLITWLFPRH